MKMFQFICYTFDFFLFDVMKHLKVAYVWDQYV